MTESINPALQILPTPKKRATYRPAALRTNSHTRVPQSSYGTSPHTPGSALSRLDSRTSSGSGATHTGVTRDHWTPDASALHCGACPALFTFLERKHHCRRCGGIFCSAHSQYTVTLDSMAQFSPAGQTSRACPSCRREYELWMNPPNIQSSSSTGATSSSSSGALGKSSVVRPQKVLGRGGRGARGAGQMDGEDATDEMRGLPAASVPSDWTWSTF